MCFGRILRTVLIKTYMDACPDLVKLLVHSYELLCRVFRDWVTYILCLSILR